jgi:endonuclease/exonuclease/phosphatase family metal-dependent hydrolase
LRLVVALLAVLVAATSVAAAAPHESVQAPLSTLNLLQFNVLEGATGSRTAPVIAAIKTSGADVVTLDEVKVKSVFDQMAQATGFYSMWVPGNDGYSVGILSRFPLRNCQPYVQSPIRHAAYGCRVQIGRKSWWIFGAHLYCCDENVRAQEIAFLISEMKKHPRLPVVLAGDLNAQTPGENEQKLLLVIPMLRTAGYIDSYRELRTAQQNPGFTITPAPYGQWERRIDYVFHSAAARAVAARVVSSVPGFTWPSDHAALHVKLVDRPAKRVG